MYHIENALKNETYNEFDKSDAKKRKKVLEDLREKLNSPMPPEKKISQYKLYKCEWKIGDTYAYPLDADIWKDTDFYGEYLIMQKIRELDWGPGHIVPVVRIKVTKDKEIPAKKEEIEILPNVPTFIMRREKLYYYMIALGNTSKRIIPKKLIYMGNHSIFKSPDNEEIVDFKNMYVYSEWKYFDKYIMHYHSMKSIKYTYHGNLLYTHLKKFFCPKCGTQVKLGRERKLVNSRSPEAKNYNFSMCGDYLIGDVEFSMGALYCPR